MSDRLKSSLTAALAAAMLLIPAPARADERLESVAASSRQWTGVTVSSTGRIFVNYPRWSKGLPYSVAELDETGSPTPYPNKEWNQWTGKEQPLKRFVAVQSVHVDANDNLWVLDTGNPLFAGVIPNGPKLVQIELATNRVKRTVVFPQTVVKSNSYLNDVRIDTTTQTAFITDSGDGALIVVYLSTQRFKRVLDDHPATGAEEGVTVTIDGKAWLRNGEAPQVHSDGIALDDKGGYLYFQALTGKTLYRIKTVDLRDPTLDNDAIAKRLEKVAEVGPSDGLLWGPGDRLYLTSLEKNAIQALTAEGKLEIVVQGADIAWPDSLAADAEGRLYFTTSRIHEGSQPTDAYKLLRVPTR